MKIKNFLNLVCMLWEDRSDNQDRSQAIACRGYCSDLMSESVEVLKQTLIVEMTNLDLSISSDRIINNSKVLVLDSWDETVAVNPEKSNKKKACYIFKIFFMEPGCKKR